MILDANRKSVKVRVKCFICDFEVVFEKKINEHGFLEIPEAYCPKCFLIMDQIIDGGEE